MAGELTSEVLESLAQYQRDLVEWRQLNDQGLDCCNWKRKEELNKKLKAQADCFWDLGISVYK